jgi:hypothetical protein
VILLSDLDGIPRANNRGTSLVKGAGVQRHKIQRTARGCHITISIIIIIITIVLNYDLLKLHSFVLIY